MRSPILRFAMTAAFFVTLTTSTLTFKDALASCGPGTLGSISFVFGHVRSAGKPGVTEQTDSSTNGITTVRFTKGSLTSVVIADGRSRTVNAKNVQTANRNQVACVSPD